MSIIYKNREIEVIDFHVHTFPDNIAPKALGRLQDMSGITPTTNGTVAHTLSTMTINHIDKSVLLNIATSPTQNKTINSCACEVNAQYSDKLIAFGSVHFGADDVLSELDRIKQLGLVGIKLHPDYQGFMINDSFMLPIYEKCEQLSLIVVFHSGFDCYSPTLVHAKPEFSLEVIKMFPKLKIVLAHFGGLHFWDDVEKFLIGENVYLDTSMCYSYSDKKQIERMMQNHNEDKILLGSDCPWENPKNSIEFILSMNLSDELKVKILGKNAKTLLGF